MSQARIPFSVRALARTALSSGNFIGALQEAAIGAGHPKPVYTVTRLGGSAHEPEFRCRVTDAGYYVDGNAKSKQQAKHLAARCWINTHGGGGT